ncbi:MAG: hypothetical protein LQ345_002882 [Seirophora villosa]|nr:MAG: hypothetical protein LQ345_002882 [Seirophora villosa]
MDSSTIRSVPDAVGPTFERTKPPKDKIYKGIVNYTVKQNYRADLRQEAVARASAIRQSNRAKKGTPEKKARGVKAKAVAEKDT